MSKDIKNIGESELTAACDNGIDSSKELVTKGENEAEAIAHVSSPTLPKISSVIHDTHSSIADVFDTKEKLELFHQHQVLDSTYRGEKPIKFNSKRLINYADLVTSSVKKSQKTQSELDMKNFQDFMLARRPEDERTSEVEGLWFENSSGELLESQKTRIVEVVKEFLERIQHTELVKEVREALDNRDFNGLLQIAFNTSPHTTHNYKLWSEAYFILVLIDAIIDIDSAEDKDFNHDYTTHLRIACEDLVAPVRDDNGIISHYIFNPDENGDFDPKYSTYIKDLVVAETKEMTSTIRKFLDKENFEEINDRIRLKVTLLSKEKPVEDIAKIIAVFKKRFGTKQLKKIHNSFSGDANNPNSTGKLKRYNMITKARTELLKCTNNYHIEIKEGAVDFEKIMAFIEEQIINFKAKLEEAIFVSPEEIYSEEEKPLAVELKREKNVVPQKVQVTPIVLIGNNDDDLREILDEILEFINDYFPGNESLKEYIKQANTARDLLNILVPTELFNNSHSINDFKDSLDINFDELIQIEANAPFDYKISQYALHYNIKSIHTIPHQKEIMDFTKTKLICLLQQEFPSIHKVTYEDGEGSIDQKKKVKFEVQIVEDVAKEEEVKDHQEYKENQIESLKKKFYIQRQMQAFLKDYIEWMVHDFETIIHNLEGENNQRSDKEEVNTLLNKYFLQIIASLMARKTINANGDEIIEIKPFLSKEKHQSLSFKQQINECYNYYRDNQQRFDNYTPYFLIFGYKNRQLSQTLPILATKTQNGTHTYVYMDGYVKGNKLATNESYQVSAEYISDSDFNPQTISIPTIVLSSNNIILDILGPKVKKPEIKLIKGNAYNSEDIVSLHSYAKVYTEPYEYDQFKVKFKRSSSSDDDTMTPLLSKDHGDTINFATKSLNNIKNEPIPSKEGDYNCELTLMSEDMKVENINFDLQMKEHKQTDQSLIRLINYALGWGNGIVSPYEAASAIAAITCHLEDLKEANPSKNPSETSSSQSEPSAKEQFLEYLRSPSEDIVVDENSIFSDLQKVIKSYIAKTKKTA